MNAPVLIASDKPSRPLVSRFMRAAVTRLWQNGFDTEQIAKRTGCSEAAVYNYLASRRG
jgi:predicted transcriptional regulator